MSTRLPLAAVMPALLLLGACTAADWDAFWPQRPVTASSQTPQPTATSPATAPTTGDQNGNRAARVAPPPPPRPSTPLSPPSGSVEIKLVGLSQAETEAVIGPPVEQADRPPAKVWRYRAADCVVDVYFYLDVARNAFYALHYDSGSGTATPTPAATGETVADRCLRRIYDGRRQSR